MLLRSTIRNKIGIVQAQRKLTKRMPNIITTLHAPNHAVKLSFVKKKAELYKVFDIELRVVNTSLKNMNDPQVSSSIISDLTRIVLSIYACQIKVISFFRVITPILPL